MEAKKGGEIELPDWKEAYEAAKKMAGIEVPHSVEVVVGWLVLIALAMALIVFIAKQAAELTDLWEEKILPHIYKPEQREKAKARRQFAEHLALDIAGKNRAENWRDQQYTELEADVEAEGRQRSMLHFGRRSSGIWRERSLAKALRRTAERLILLEGDPGAGKSVALRHIAFLMAEKAKTSASAATVLPIYLNLKALRREPGEAVNSDLIRKFVLTSLKSANDRYVDEFVDQNYGDGVRNGKWLFLFDSFDELPDILSSVEGDNAITEYSTAINDFLGGFNACRAVLASRFYRGPVREGWTTFRILPLSPQRQHLLIRQAFVNYPARSKKVFDGLAAASDDLLVMARNPMLLGLLCEHVTADKPFPKTSHDVFSAYLGERFARDQARVEGRFGVPVSDLVELARKIAFTMTADTSIGLSPTYDEIRDALGVQNFDVAPSVLEATLGALVYLRVGRSGLEASDRGEPQFTFAHRRFQEYFTTAMVIENPDLVTPHQLLFDARWRETAVVLLQTGLSTVTHSILDMASQFVAQAADAAFPPEGNASSFKWPQKVLHVFGILQAGAALNPTLLPAGLREQVGVFLGKAFKSGTLLDKKWALEVAGITPQNILVELLTDALDIESTWLNDVVFTQAARLVRPVERVSRWMRLAVLKISLNGELFLSNRSLNAYISRLPDSRDMKSIVNTARWMPFVDGILFPILFSIASFFIDGENIYFSISVLLVFIFCSFMKLKMYGKLEKNFYEFLCVESYAIAMFLIFVKPFFKDEGNIFNFQYMCFLSSWAIFCIYLATWLFAYIKTVETTGVPGFFEMVFLPFSSAINLLKGFFKFDKEWPKKVLLISISVILILLIFFYAWFIFSERHSIFAIFAILSPVIILIFVSLIISTFAAISYLYSFVMDLFFLFNMNMISFDSDRVEFVTGNFNKIKRPYCKLVALRNVVEVGSNDLLRAHIKSIEMILASDSILSEMEKGNPLHGLKPFKSSEKIGMAKYAEDFFNTAMWLFWAQEYKFVSEQRDIIYRIIERVGYTE